MREINKFYEKAKIVVYATDIDTGVKLTPTWTIFGASKEEDGYYYLYADGTTRNMMVQCSGYLSKRIEFSVTGEEAKAGIKEFSVALTKNS